MPKVRRKQRRRRKGGNGSRNRIVQECLTGQLCVDDAETMRMTYERLKRPEDPHLSVEYFTEAIRLGDRPDHAFTLACEVDEVTSGVEARHQVGGGDGDANEPGPAIYRAGSVAEQEPLIRDQGEEEEDGEERYFYHAVGDDNPDYVPDHIYTSKTTGRSYAYKPDSQFIRNGDTGKSIPGPKGTKDATFDDLWVDPYAEGDHMIEEVSAEHRASFDQFLEKELPALSENRPVQRQVNSIAAKRDDPDKVIAITKSAVQQETDPTNVVNAEDESADIGACAYRSVSRSLTSAYRRHLLTCGKETNFQRLWMWLETHLNSENATNFTLRGLINTIRLRSGWPYSIEPRGASPALPRHYILGVKLNTIDDDEQRQTINNLGDGTEEHFQTRQSIIDFTLDYLGCTLMLGPARSVKPSDFEAVNTIEKAAKSRMSVILCRATFAPMA